jgi:hypothetical protein
MYKFVQNTNDRQFGDVHLVFTMNYKAISNKICHLVEQMNTWSSTITIPQGDEYIDISSAAMGKLSTTPIGAYNQPLTFPKGKSASFFQFDPKIFNENSWPMLKDVLTKVGMLVDVDWRYLMWHLGKLVIVWLRTHSAAHMEEYIEIQVLLLLRKVILGRVMWLLSLSSG